VGDGAEMVPIGQGFADLSAPSRELEKLILGGELRHGGHPILAWMADHVEIEEDAAGNIKPSKRRSAERIDGIVALIMAIRRWQAHLEPTPSV
jgi:phage terminase large subunit-like protein